MNNLSFTTNSTPVKSARSALRKPLPDATQSSRPRTVSIPCQPPHSNLGMLMDPVSNVQLSAKTISDGERKRSEELRRVNWGDSNLISCTYGPSEYDRTCEHLPYFGWTARQQHTLLQELRNELRSVYVHPSSPSALSTTIMPYKEDIPIMKEWGTKLVSIFQRLLQPSPVTHEAYENHKQHFHGRGL